MLPSRTDGSSFVATYKVLETSKRYNNWLVAFYEVAFAFSTEIYIYNIPIRSTQTCCFQFLGAQVCNFSLLAKAVLACSANI